MELRGGGEGAEEVVAEVGVCLSGEGEAGEGVVGEAWEVGLVGGCGIGRGACRWGRLTPMQRCSVRTRSQWHHRDR